MHVLCMHYSSIVVAGKFGEDFNLAIWRNKKICPWCILLYQHAMCTIHTCVWTFDHHSALWRKKHLYVCVVIPLSPRIRKI